ncbi:MAG: hypothetical protein A2Z40_01605 [Deltaproteobacteria bacterium RBG_19FT_COMBO_60_16]|nr:MAG: hypothetical protein A2Z40_01605 [Deltaproteobacteria bacterium RBG_19FT_COMBO_60_16]
MTVTIEIGTRGVALAFAFFGAGGAVTPGDEVETPGGGTLTYLAHIEDPTREIPTILVVALDVGNGADVPAISAWMEETIGGRALSMTVDRVEVEPHRGAIERALRERMPAGSRETTSLSP